jgi:hypothetical protein
MFLPDTDTVTLPDNVVLLSFIVDIPLRHGIDRGNTEPSSHAAALPVILNVSSFIAEPAEKLLFTSYTRAVNVHASVPSATTVVLSAVIIVTAAGPGTAVIVPVPVLVTLSIQQLTVIMPVLVLLLILNDAIPLMHGIVHADTEPSNHVAGDPAAKDPVIWLLSDVMILLLLSVTCAVMFTMEFPSATISADCIATTSFVTEPVTLNTLVVPLINPGLVAVTTISPATTVLLISSSIFPFTVSYTRWLGNRAGPDTLNVTVLLAVYVDPAGPFNQTPLISLMYAVTWTVDVPVAIIDCRSVTRSIETGCPSIDD